MSSGSGHQYGEGHHFSAAASSSQSHSSSSASHSTGRRLPPPDDDDDRRGTTVTGGSGGHDDIIPQNLGMSRRVVGLGVGTYRTTTTTTAATGGGFEASTVSSSSSPSPSADYYRRPGGQQQQQQQQQQYYHHHHAEVINEEDDDPAHPKLMDVERVDKILPRATHCIVVFWILLVSAVYGLTDPEKHWEYLEGTERDIARAAFFTLVILTLSFMIPFAVQSKRTNLPSVGGRGNNTSGIVWSAFLFLVVAILNNALLAFGPVVVFFDPYSNARVFFTRWCEWIPLSGLQTFYVEAVSVRATETGLLEAMLSGLAQNLSCLCALVFPFCPNFYAWLFVQFVSCGLYLVLVPRVLEKRKLFMNAKKGLSRSQVEDYYRLRFAYRMSVVCLVVWTILVVIYYLVALLMNVLPEGHWLNTPSLAMAGDCFFDCVCKALFLRVIVEVHEGVFDAQGRTARQLNDLRRMMSALWESSSDVIVVSARQGRKLANLASPTFVTLMGAGMTPQPPTTTSATSTTSAGPETTTTTTTMPTAAGATASRASFSRERQEQQQREEEEQKLAILIEMEDSAGGGGGGGGAFRGGRGGSNNKTNKSIAYYVDGGQTPYMMDGTTGLGHHQDLDMYQHREQQQPVPPLVVQQAEAVVRAAWDMDNNTLAVHDLTKLDGSVLKCELKVTHHDSDGLIVVVRDITERCLRYEAEQRAHAEFTARQKDAAAVNRFTRHEIKNGLLSCIEMCEWLRNCLNDIGGSGSGDGDGDGDGDGSGSDVSPAQEQQLQVLHQQVTAKLNALDIPLPQIFPDPQRTGNMGVLSSTKAAIHRYIDELETALHEILDTVLAEAMARDVIHGVYQPKPERVDVKKWLSATRLSTGETDRFPIHLAPADMPPLALDPQLLRYIHRNAVSNAMKYGKVGGRVLTDVRFFPDLKEFEMDVINYPGEGHGQLLSMGSEASTEVFAQGTRLSIHSSHQSDRLSSGDGAWIMQKCAKTMGGFCDIRFERDQTVFSFRCPAKQCNRHAMLSAAEASAEFQVPAGTYGIAIDDSPVQRRLMTRILLHIGVEGSKIVVLGEDSSVKDRFRAALDKILSLDGKSKILALVDENLDYMDTDGIRLSGSLLTQEILAAMSAEHSSRIFALIRSANDANEDIQLYQSRAHGFFPKASMDQHRVRETMAPLWAMRYPPQRDPLLGEAGMADDDVPFGGMVGSSLEGELVTKQELLQSLHRVEAVLEMDTEAVTWERLWSSLHGLMGDLRVIESIADAPVAAQLIETMRGDTKPAEFADKWDEVHRLVSAVVAGLH